MIAEIPLIHVWGPPGAGRHETVSQLLGRSNEVCGDTDYEAPFGEKQLIVRYSSLATKLFYRPDDPSRPHELVPVIDRLAESAGILFVADSQMVRRGHNTGWLARLRADLALRRKDLDEIPVVFLLNKRDLQDIASAQELVGDLRTGRCTHVASVATKQIGIAEALAKLVAMIGVGA